TVTNALQAEPNQSGSGEGFVVLVERVQQGENQFRLDGRIAHDLKHISGVVFDERQPRVDRILQYLERVGHPLRVREKTVHLGGGGKVFNVAEQMVHLHVVLSGGIVFQRLDHSTVTG